MTRSGIMHSSKKTIFFVLIAIVATFAVTTAISVFLRRIMNVDIPSLGALKTLGAEAYWDADLKEKTQAIVWDTIWPGKSNNATIYIRSTSNVETYLILGASNWDPAGISEYMTLSWNYGGALIQPGAIIQVTLTLSASSSDAFVSYLISNEVKQFRFDISISTGENTR